MYLIEIYRYLERCLDGEDAPQISKFSNYVGADGVMVLEAIGANSSELIVRDVVIHLYRMQSWGHPGGLVGQGTVLATYDTAGASAPPYTQARDVPPATVGASPSIYPTIQQEEIPLMEVRAKRE
jgi:hypothetical protein